MTLLKRLLNIQFTKQGCFCLLILIELQFLALPIYANEKLENYLKIQLEGQTKEGYILEQKIINKISTQSLTYFVGNAVLKEQYLSKSLYRSLLSEGKKYLTSFNVGSNCGHAGISFIELEKKKKELIPFVKTFCNPTAENQKQWQSLTRWFQKLKNISSGVLKLPNGN